MLLGGVRPCARGRRHRPRSVRYAAAGHAARPARAGGRRRRRRRYRGVAVAGHVGRVRGRDVRELGRLVARPRVRRRVSRLRRPLRRGRYHRVRQAIAVVRASEGAGSRWTVGLRWSRRRGRGRPSRRISCRSTRPACPTTCWSARCSRRIPACSSGIERALGTDNEVCALEARRGAVAASRQVDADMLSVLDTLGDVHTPVQLPPCCATCTAPRRRWPGQPCCGIVREALAAGHLVVVGDP